MVFQLEFEIAQRQALTKQGRDGHNGKHGEHEGMDTWHPQPIKKARKEWHASMHAWQEQKARECGT